MKASEQVYWVKTALGIVTGSLCFFIQSSFELQGQLMLMIGATLYIGYSEALAILFKVDRDRTIKIAIGAFLFTWIFTWTFFNTLGYYGWI